MRPDEMNPPAAHFVRETFSPEVAGTYERVNHILTFGLDVLWRRRAARMAAGGGGTQWADLCTGTGETAVYLRRLAPQGITVHAVDFSPAMIAMAKKKPEARDIRFSIADVKALAFPDESLDLITISFASRNLNLSRDILVQTFAGFCRVLKPGGRFIHLETSQPSSRLLRWLFHAYVKRFVKPVGGRISGSSNGYAYLTHTLPRFHPPEELSRILNQAGFQNVTCQKLLFGIAAIHQGLKA